MIANMYTFLSKSVQYNMIRSTQYVHKSITYDKSTLIAEYEAANYLDCYDFEAVAHKRKLVCVSQSIKVEVANVI